MNKRVSGSGSHLRSPYRRHTRRGALQVHGALNLGTKKKYLFRR